MSDEEPFSTPNRTPPLPRQPKPAEVLFEFLHGDNRIRCEVRDHGESGVEAEFFANDEFHFSRRFDTRALAVQWAEEERRNIEKGGAR